MYYKSNGISITYSETRVKISISNMRNAVFNKVVFSLICKDLAFIVSSMID
jgi:hypothetical protein